KITTCFLECFPLGNVKRRNCYKKPWMTHSILKLINLKEKYVHLKQQTKDITLEDDIKACRKGIKKAIRYEKRKYYSNEFRKVSGDHKNTWKLINDVLKRKPKNIDDIRICVDPDSPKTVGNE